MQVTFDNVVLGSFGAFPIFGYFVSWKEIVMNRNGVRFGSREHQYNIYRGTFVPPVSVYRVYLLHSLSNPGHFDLHSEYKIRISRLSKSLVDTWLGPTCIWQVTKQSVKTPELLNLFPTQYIMICRRRCLEQKLHSRPLLLVLRVLPRSRLTTQKDPVLSSLIWKIEMHYV